MLVRRSSNLHIMHVHCDRDVDAYERVKECLSLLSGKTIVLLWSPVVTGSLRLSRKAQPSLQTQEKALHWLQMLLTAASSSWPIPMRRSTEALEMLQSSPHQVRSAGARVVNSSCLLTADTFFRDQALWRVLFLTPCISNTGTSK